MKLKKSLRLALNILLHSRLRSWLTIIGIVIGVAAVVAIISIGQGMQQEIESRLGGMGADIITISPGGGSAERGFRPGGPEGPGGPGGPGGSTATSTQAKNLTEKDIQVLKSIEGVKYIQGLVSGKGETYYLGEKTSASVEGVDPLAWKEMTTAELASGRFLGPSDYGAVVVGSRVFNGTFKQTLALNRILVIEGKNFKVVGILKESGGEGGEDRNVIMPIAAARDTIPGIGREKFNSIMIKVDSVDNIDVIIAEADQKLMMSRHVTEKKKDYRISSVKAMQESISSITQTLTMFLGGIAAVSLLVGAVGIANTMFTSVLEKTKEIGIMKSIGAKNSDIMAIFMLNAGMVGTVGGILGVTLGTLISALLPVLGIRIMGGGPGGGAMTTAVTPSLLISSLLLSIGIGMVAGAIPAYRASRLKPVDALHYE